MIPPSSSTSRCEHRTYKDAARHLTFVPRISRHYGRNAGLKNTASYQSNDQWKVYYTMIPLTRSPIVIESWRNRCLRGGARFLEHSKGGCGRLLVDPLLRANWRKNWLVEIVEDVHWQNKPGTAGALAEFPSGNRLTGRARQKEWPVVSCAGGGHQVGRG